MWYYIVFSIGVVAGFVIAALLAANNFEAERSIATRSGHSWISTAERLPTDPESEVLVVVNGTHNMTAFIDAYLMGWYYEDEGWVIEGYEEWEDPKVLYWMPIPELKEE